MGVSIEANDVLVTAGDPLTAVLVHGAWHDERCWVDLTPELTLRQVRWHYLTLPSTNPRHGLPGLAEDVRALNGLLDSLGRDVVLVGHGYGGMVIGESGHHSAVARLVYLAGICADFGETAAEHMAGVTPSLATLAVETSDDGLSRIKPGIGARTVYGDLSRADAEQKARLLQPSSNRALQDAAGVPAWKTKPTTYVVCGKDRLLPANRQKKMAQRATNDIVTLRAGHAPFFSSPSEIADVVARPPTNEDQPGQHEQHATRNS